MLEIFHYMHSEIYRFSFIPQYELNITSIFMIVSDTTLMSAIFKMPVKSLTKELVLV